MLQIDYFRNWSASFYILDLRVSNFWSNLVNLNNEISEPSGGNPVITFKSSISHPCVSADGAPFSVWALSEERRQVPDAPAKAQLTLRVRLAICTHNLHAPRPLPPAAREHGGGRACLPRLTLCRCRNGSALFLDWRTVDLQCHANFYCTAKWLRFTRVSSQLRCSQWLMKT